MNKSLSLNCSMSKVLSKKRLSTLNIILYETGAYRVLGTRHSKYFLCIQSSDSIICQRSLSENM